MSKLKPLAISEILGDQFFIRHYQRGYRWTKQQVEQLLDDIDSFSLENGEDKPTFYCLQPVVLKKMNTKLTSDNYLTGEWYEVIDGQQRLTTIYLILQYINEFWIGRQKKDIFKVNYETRKDSVNFLESIKVNDDDLTVDINKSNIDFYHISKAYQAIRNWEVSYNNKKNKPFKSEDFLPKLLNRSKIIWYEVEQEEDSTQLFERLNLGKIDLTNSELIKALFLSKDSFNELTTEDKRVKHYEIASLWDEIEHKLNEQDIKFWSFITNNNRDCFDTKIDLILDLISGKSDKNIDPLYTFLWLLEKSENFDEDKKISGLSSIWEEIEQFYHVLIEWSNDRELYHLIGYLISSKEVEDYKIPKLNTLVQFSMQHSKDKFRGYINQLICNSVKYDISELNYLDHSNELFNLLLLFNVEIYRTSASIDNFYPFKQHKSNMWSLEHIHAQNSEGLNKTKKDQWLQWTTLHVPVLRDLKNHPKFKKNIETIDALLYSAEGFLENTDTLDWNRFNSLSLKIANLLSSDTEKQDSQTHRLGNMALLSQPDNASLNNTAFEVKRREIIRLDKQGSFIPIATRRVFLDYYSSNNSLEHKYLWSSCDADSYVKEIKRTLSTYLPSNSHPNTLN